MSREDPQLRIRLPIELKEKVEAAAKENGRSMNSEIVQILQNALGDPPVDIVEIDSTNVSPEELAAEFARQLEEKQKEIMNVAKAFAMLVSSKKE